MWKNAAVANFMVIQANYATVFEGGTELSQVFRLLSRE
jgi:hypothetical protein